MCLRKYREESKNTIVNVKTHQIKEEYWSIFTKGMDHELTGAQCKVWGDIRSRNFEVIYAGEINIVRRRMDCLLQEYIRRRRPYNELEQPTHS